MVKFELKDLGVDFESLKGDERVFMEKIGNMIINVANKSADGTMSKEDVESQIEKIKNLIPASDETKFKALNDELDSYKEQLKTLGETLEKLKQNGLGEDYVNKFDEELDKMLGSEKYLQFANGLTKSSGGFDKFSFKDIVSMTGNYSGTHLITQQQNRIVNRAVSERSHVRDFMTILPADPEMTSVAYGQIYDVDKNARFVTENGMLPESSFKVKEETASVRRLGSYIKISKRMLKSRVYIRSFILNLLPQAVAQAEDWNILFGDGLGENFKGITSYEDVKGVEDIVSTAVCKGEAGCVTAVEAYDNEKSIVITLKEPHDEIMNGMTITFANATNNTSINKAHKVLKMNDTQLLLLGAAYTTTETSVGKITFTVTHGAHKSIEDPNSGDVVKAAFAVMTVGQYVPTAICLNPIDVLAMSCEKDTTGRNLDLVKVSNGKKYIAGYPIIETGVIAPGSYFLGDLKLGAALLDYTYLTLEWAEDAETKKTNQIELICQEEAILQVMVPWAFAYGNLSKLKLAVTKAG